MPNIGDTVRYLNSVGGGKIVRIDSGMAWVCDEDGFENPVLLRECVVVRTAEQDVASARMQLSETIPEVLSGNNSAHAQVSERYIPDDEETPDGDKVSLTIGFEPTDRKRLSQSDFEASLINDSNYYISFVLLSKTDRSDKWSCRYAGQVEPNTELYLGVFDKDIVSQFENLCLQYVAYKMRKEYEMKQPQSACIKLDPTQFVKLHCYRKNQYFDNEVLAHDLVINDEPKRDFSVDLSLPNNKTDEIKTSRSHHPLNINNVGSSTKKVAKPTAINFSEPLVIDLHINNLVDTTAGMSASDMLNIQVDRFQRVMDENLRNYGRRIIFIHGKGAGVLRQAIMKELTHRYKGHDAQDASFREYGFGATQVTIRQHPDKFSKR